MKWLVCISNLLQLCQKSETVSFILLWHKHLILTQSLKNRRVHFCHHFCYPAVLHCFYLTLLKKEKKSQKMLKVPHSGGFYSSHPPAVFWWRWLSNVSAPDYIHHTGDAEAFHAAAPLYPQCPPLPYIIFTLHCHAMLLPTACQRSGK